MYTCYINTYFADRLIMPDNIKTGGSIMKKWIAALLCGVMVVSLAACSGGSGSSSDGGGEDSAEGGKTVELWTCWTEGADTEE